MILLRHMFDGVKIAHKPLKDQSYFFDIFHEKYFTTFTVVRPSLFRPGTQWACTCDNSASGNDSATYIHDSRPRDLRLSMEETRKGGMTSSRFRQNGIKQYQQQKHLYIYLTPTGSEIPKT